MVGFTFTYAHKAYHHQSCESRVCIYLLISIRNCLKLLKFAPVCIFKTSVVSLSCFSFVISRKNNVICDTCIPSSLYKYLQIYKSKSGGNGDITLVRWFPVQVRIYDVELSYFLWSFFLLQSVLLFCFLFRIINKKDFVLSRY